MCDVIGQALNAVPEPQRRGILKALAVGAGAVALGTATSGAPAAAATSGKGHRTRLVTIGTMGGPTYMVPGATGICTAIVYGDRHYLVDLGMGSYHGFVQSAPGARSRSLAPATAAHCRACSRRTGPPRRWSTHRTRLRGSAA